MTVSVSPRLRSGFSLPEVLVSLVIFGAVTAAAFGFLLSQSKGYRTLAARSAQIQNGRFGRDVMRQEIRTTGTNVTDEQPMVVLANDSTFAFNSDLLTNRLDSSRFTGAVYVDTYATAAEANTLTAAQAITVPGSSPAVTYPLADYTAIAGTLGEAELIVFRFTRDTTSSDAQDYMLLRQVNAKAPEIIATGLRRTTTSPFFRYWYDPSRYDPTLTDLDTVPRAWLPLAKTVASRGLVPDTGTAATTRIDQVRAVEVAYETNKPVNGRRDVVRYMIPLPNTAVTRQSRACGRPPIAPSAPSATWDTDSAAVMLSWAKSADDGAGEGDAVRYVLWRRLTGATMWNEPLATVSVVGSAATYRYKDAGVETGSGRSYQYGLAVQDCTPNLSSLSASASVIVP
jgi:prepilin-type N-terminal cleavage/methylation domain-containing protein